jgi:hypothetical protein
MIGNSEPMCSDGAVQSKPMYAVIVDEHASASRASGSETWWMNPRLARTLRKSDLYVLMAVVLAGRFRAEAALV